MRKISLRIAAITLAMLLCIPLFASCGGDGEGEPAVNTYTITFDSKGGSEVAPRQVEHGDCATEPPYPTREGYIFDGWFTDGEMEWDFDLQEVKSDMKLHAKWVDVKDQYSYRVTDEITGEQGAILTGINNPEYEIIELPTMIAGYPVVGIDNEALVSVSSEYTSRLSIPAGVRYIGDRALAGVAGVNISFAEGCTLTYVGEGAFKNCTSLTGVPLADGLDTIRFETFAGCTSLASLRLPKSVRVIEENAFTGCSGLLSIVLHSELESVEDMAFEECNAFAAVYLYGDAEDVEQMLEKKIIFTNTALLDAKWMLYSETEPTGTDGEYDYWYFTPSGTVRVW